LSGTAVTWLTQYTSAPSVVSEMTLPMGDPIRTITGSQNPALHDTPLSH
jgi:hypothetical protein